MCIQVSEYMQFLIQSIHVTDQILGSFCQRRRRIDGILRRLEQPFNFGCHRVWQGLHLMTFHAFITELLCRTNSKVIIEKFPHLRQTTYERLIQTLSEVESGKVFRRIFWVPGEYVESISDIQSTLQEIRKVLGEIPILASKQWLLDEANRGRSQMEMRVERRMRSRRREEGSREYLKMGRMPLSLHVRARQLRGWRL